MPVFWTNRFKRDWKKLPAGIKEKTKQIALLLEENQMHPSLRLKRLHRLPGYWELRVTDNWGIILTIGGDAYTFVTIGAHDIVDKG